jgi:signal transduction histidine kinase
MLTNKNIVKYCFKYFWLIVIGAYVYDMSAKLINQKSDVANLIGTAFFAGLILAVVLILKSDVIKLVKNLKEDNQNE